MRRHIPLPIKVLRSHIAPCPRARPRIARRCSSTLQDEPVSPSSSADLDSEPEPEPDLGRSSIASSSRTIYDPVITEGYTKPFYITAPPFSTTGPPHLGHFHSIVLADTFSRFSTLRYPDRPVHLSTITSDRGPLVQRTSERLGTEAWTISGTAKQRYKELIDSSNVDKTDLLSTEEERHVTAVQDFWERLVAAGDIYQTSREGWHTPLGEYVTEDLVKQSDHGRVVTSDGQTVIWDKGTVWMFRLSKFRQELLSWVERPLSIHPPSLRFKLMSLVASVEDVPVSRPSRSDGDRGINVPGDQDQMVHESMDGLVTYITSLGYPGYTDIWPADIHVTSMDMLQSHIALWPAMLMSAGISPPRSIFAHGHWIKSGIKLSRESGNTLDPRSIMRFYGAEAGRWHVLRSGPGSKDIEFSIKQLEDDYSFLSSRWGHLANRILSMSLLVKGQEFDAGQRDGELESLMSSTKDEFVRYMERLDVPRACEMVVDLVQGAHRMWTDSKPWKAVDPATSLYYAYHSLRISGILLQPILPVKSQEMLDRLAVPSTERALEDASLTVDPDTVDMGKTLERLVEGSRMVDRLALSTMFAQLRWKKDELETYGRVLKPAS